MLATLIRQTLFPSFCVYCRAFLDTDASLCTECDQLIKPIVTCPLKITENYEVKVFAAGEYKDPLRTLILSKKYGQIESARLLGDLVWGHSCVGSVPFDLIVPIPLHWTRYAWRWFNQAEEMGKSISKKSGKPLLSALSRIKRTHFQAEFSREERAQNVKHVFALTVNPTLVKDKHILLVDDVMTTGATLKEAVKVLRSNGVSSITIAVASRVV